MKKMLVVVLALPGLLLAACGTETATDDKTSAESTSEPTTPTEDAPEAESIRAEAVVAEFEDNSGKTIKEMGDRSTWHPWFVGVEDQTASDIRINMAVPGDYDETQRETLANAAGIEFFNRTGEAFPELGQIIVAVDGRTTATVQRDDAARMGG